MINGHTISSSPTFTLALQESKKLLNLPPSGIHIVSLFPWIVWTIWLTRNQRIFEYKRFDEQDTLAKAINDAKEWHEAQQVIPQATEQQEPTLPRPTTT